jgi:hypothetical protein
MPICEACHKKRADGVYTDDGFICKPCAAELWWSEQTETLLKAAYRLLRKPPSEWRTNAAESWIARYKQFGFKLPENLRRPLTKSELGLLAKPELK